MDDSIRKQEQQKVWERFFKQQTFNLTKDKVAIQWMDAWSDMQLTSDMPLPIDLMVPNWTIVPILGKMNEPDFFYYLSQGCFPMNLNVRDMDEFTYLEERDFLHDCMHLPHLHIPQMSAFLKTMGLFYCNYMADSDEARQVMSNIYWFAVEFSTISELGQIKALGAGIISSYDELNYVTSGSADVRPWDIEAVASEYDYPTASFQTHYYYLNSLEEFDTIIPWLFANYSKY